MATPIAMGKRLMATAKGTSDFHREICHRLEEVLGHRYQRGDHGGRS